MFHYLLTLGFVTAPIMSHAEEEKPRPRVDPVEGKKIYGEMRDMALKHTRKAINLPAGKSGTEPFGIVVDMSLGDGFATVFAKPFEKIAERKKTIIKRYFDTNYSFTNFLTVICFESLSMSRTM